jgi:hypothetical protein
MQPGSHVATGRPTGEAERTRALVQAKELAERESPAKAAFFADMSHEIRTPMHSILGWRARERQGRRGRPVPERRFAPARAHLNYPAAVGPHRRAPLLGAAMRILILGAGAIGAITPTLGPSTPILPLLNGLLAQTPGEAALAEEGAALMHPETREHRTRRDASAN